MKRVKRTIDVFEQGNVRVEVEGNTVSIQVVDPAKPQNVWRGVLPRPVVRVLSEVLNTALAIEGGVVVESGLVNTDKRAAQDSGREADSVPLGN